MKTLLTFESVHFALDAESKLKERGLSPKTIPTPRELTSHCGLSILVDYLKMEELELIKEGLDIKNAYIFEKIEGNKNKIEKLI